MADFGRQVAGSAAEKTLPMVGGRNWVAVAAKRTFAIMLALALMCSVIAAILMLRLAIWLPAFLH
jgi:hypothetical protein